MRHRSLLIIWSHVDYSLIFLFLWYCQRMVYTTQLMYLLLAWSCFENVFLIYFSKVLSVFMDLIKLNLWSLTYSFFFPLGVINLLLSFFFFFWPHSMACEILVSHPGIKPTTPTVEACSLNQQPRKTLSRFLSEPPRVR